MSGLALLRIGYFVAVLVFLAFALLPAGSGAPMLNINDKVQHFLAFFVLAFAGKMLWPDHRVWLALVWLTAFGALIEVLQWLMALGRQAEWLDLGADIAGSVVGIALARWLLSRGIGLKSAS